MNGSLTRLDKMRINSKRKQIRKTDVEKERILSVTQTATLLDYVKWIGDFDFDTMPFREADALVLCVASYFEILPLFAEGRKSAKFSECGPLLDAGRARLMITGGDMGNEGIFRAAAESKRFGELDITDYVDKLTTDPPLQFATMCFRYKDKFAFIAYRGTDSSLAGWEENFMISFTRTTAQNMAAEHASLLISPGCDWYIGGHSKGGNLALTAACVLDDEQLGLVKRVFVLDGPGLCPEVFDEKLIQRIDSKTTKIIPEFDVIGKLFEPRITDTRIVKSYRKGIEEHSLASWMVDHGDLSKAAGNAPGSRWINSIVDEWIAPLPLEERAVFVSELFDAMEEEGIRDLQEVSPEYLGNLIIRLSGKSATTRKVVASLPRRMLLDDVEKPKTSQRVRKLFSNKVLITALILILAGLAFILGRNKILDVIAISLVALIAAAEIFVIIRKLIKTKGKMDGLRERLIITAALLALIPIVLIKEMAPFILGSFIFGVLFIALAFISGEQAARETRIFMRVFNVFECILCAVAGVIFLIVPQKFVPLFALILGIVMLSDAAIRIVFCIWYRIKQHSKKAVKVVPDQEQSLY
ncbi:MAG: DUF2974 domain-containing protein [Clostridia bacterium]|nr:DUF2974 domain-containing protein [Clostridia bacterium]